VNLDSFLKTIDLCITPEIVLESVDLLIEFAKIGLGVAHVLRVSALESIENGELFEVLIRETLPMRKLGIISMENVPLSNAAERFINHLCQ
jgi:DNA-binding transcriptional LysR family regulator